MLKRYISVFILCLLGFIYVVEGEAKENNTVILATTTSVQDNGLLDVLVDGFQKKSGITIKTIAVGTGQALKLGRTGEADILLVHSPEDEKDFMDEGYGKERITFMHNDFVILGPKDNPANIIREDKAPDAFKKIAESKSLFVSRADDSGTHKKEKQIWNKAGVLPAKEPYIEAGQGMAATVIIANEKSGYCLTDRPTYLSLKRDIDLLILCEGDPLLSNHYSLILVNPDRFSKINARGAKEFSNYLLSNDAKNNVENFGKEKFGGQIFFWDYN